MSRRLKSAEETLASVVGTIGHIYQRPLMYGGDANGVEVLLVAYHHLWAEIVGREDDLGSARDAVSEGHQAMNFSTFFRREVPGGDRATESEAASFVVDHWKRIDEALGLIIPMVDMEKERETILNRIKTGGPY